MSTPARRSQMVANHLAQRNASSTATVPKSDDEKPVVVVEALHAMRKLILNRPKALNSLNEEMIDLIQSNLATIEKSELANVILIKSNGKHFCAGGDVVTLSKYLEDEKTWVKASSFFEKEYETNHLLATTAKPVVAIMNGVTFGGGVGITGHGAFRIATETTQIAMPETKIGLFPDVGANFILPRLDGQLGLYLGLTSFPLKGAATYLAGLATHYVPTDRLTDLEHRLSELDVTATHETVNACIEEFAADQEELRAALEAYPLVGPIRRAIDVIFARATAEEMIEDLAKLYEKERPDDAECPEPDVSRFVLPHERHEFDAQLLRSWARETREAIELRSPTSVKLTIKAIRQGRNLTIDDVFKMDARIAAACCSPSVHPDFRHGVNELLIKKHKPEEKRPDWKPATLGEVSDDHVQKTFFSHPPPFTNPPLPKLNLSRMQRGAQAYPTYRVSPHAKWLLPSERDVEKVVKGEDAGSDEYAVTRQEIIDRLVARWRGKVGVVEKVEEVLSRKTVVAEQDTLKWVS
ncbi:3-hydroxyisobutyrate dehydrogenase [Rhodotorula toruloides]|uniref:3-hydroxyisobutyryl-CoA hydrolase n=1 Tax=Rhodotorula toruloides TaxID=5286 RepID=A0A511KHV2_RHOTO|nr:3-hydroxyisobutyrate dehydrogenase [Rhodotorula toruloides]